ncbi:MAG TPA: hypothetical protein VLX61_06840 [Anaerolineales bacterium]|nr:hypothetical protein [Anaerolineales bacterium]
MTTALKSAEQERPMQKVIYRGAASAPVYGLGLIGALVYYVGHATTFWLGVLGFVQAVLWPAMLVYELLKYLHV